MSNSHIKKAKISQIEAGNVYGQIDGITYRVVDPTGDEKIGQEIEGFAYENRFKKLVIQLKKPLCDEDGFYNLEVVEVVPKVGVFVNMGLVAKDLAVSLDDLPEETSLWPKVGDRLFVRLITDSKGRLWGKLAKAEDLEDDYQRAPREMMNQPLKAQVHTLRTEGVSCITQQGYSGFVHESQLDKPLRLGEVFTARVIEVKRDRTVNLSTLPRAHEVIDDDASMLLKILERSFNNYLPLHDRSEPNEIKRELGISKGRFKRAVGNLLRNNLIEQKLDDGIYLIKDDAND